jgi:EpsG-like putative glucosyltransferase
MLPYIMVASVLWILAVAEVGASSRVWERLALMTVLYFGALRFETGFDWVAYQDAFQTLPDPAYALHYGIPPQNLEMEPLYTWLSVLLKALTDDATALFILAALFSITVLHVAVGRVSRSQCLVWLVYFGLVFLAVQMSAIRSAVAASLVLLGLTLSAAGRSIRGTLLIALAVGVHVVAAIFLPLPFLKRWSPPNWLCLLVVLVGVIFLQAALLPVDRLFDLILPYMPTLVFKKVETAYYGLDPAPLSLATLALICFHATLLYTFCSRRERERQDPYVIVAIWLTLYMLVAHLYFVGFPAVWNRIMYVALPWQIAALWRTTMLERISNAMKRVIVVFFGVASMGALVYFLTSPAALVFIPYQSIIVAWWTDDEGDGFVRSQEWFDYYEESFGTRHLVERPAQRPTEFRPTEGGRRAFRGGSINWRE